MLRDRALSGFWSDLFSPMNVPGTSDDEILACVQKGNEASAPIDNRRYDLAKNWHPSEYFEPEAIRQAVASVQAVLSTAFDTLALARNSCDDAPGCEFPTGQDRYNNLVRQTDRSRLYLQAADEADTSASATFKTAYVWAGDFKDFVLAALGAASDAVTDSSVIGCLMPWWSEAIAKFKDVVFAAAAVISNILGVSADIVEAAYTTGRAVVQAAKEGFDFVGWLAHYFPWLVGGAVLFFGGRFAWQNRAWLKSRFKRKQLTGRRY